MQEIVKEVGYTMDIFRAVSDYLEHRITLEELEDWEVANLQLLFSLPSKLVDMIELGLAEMSEGHCTEEEFRALLRAELAEHHIVGGRQGDHG